MSNVSDLLREVYLEKIVVPPPDKCKILTDALPVKYERNHRCAVNGCWNRPHLMTMQQLVYETESIGGFYNA